MSNAQDIVARMLDSIGVTPLHFHGPDMAYLEVHSNKVMGSHLLPGLTVDVVEHAEGIEAKLRVASGVKFQKPIQICFGMLPETGLQHIILDITMEENSQAAVVAHCTFPNAQKVVHKMDAQIHVAPGADYSYFERHVHGPYGGVQVVPKAKVEVGVGARFKTEFELLKGRVGAIDIDYEVTCQAQASLEMIARIFGRDTDSIRIHETGYLVGESSRAVLQSHIALRNQAQAEVHNKLVASAPYARGHVDCKEIVQDQAVAQAIPVVEVRHSKAHVTHEAAIGSVDTKQLQTLLARGLTEDKAVELIIEGLLSPRTPND